ncbi:MAG: hypothetical protein QM642_06750 [Edaphocola sp.]
MLAALVLMGAAATFAQQTTTKTETKTTVSHVKKDGTPDKRFKDNKKLKKDGTPDKRFKANKTKTTSTTATKVAN